MINFEEIEKLAMELPEEQRAELAARVLDSLRPVLTYDDEGVTEARRRAAEMDANPSIGISLEELDRRIRQRK